MIKLLACRTMPSESLDSDCDKHCTDFLGSSKKQDKIDVPKLLANIPGLLRSIRRPLLLSFH